MNERSEAKQKGLLLSGNLQIVAAEMALRRYKTGSKALEYIINLKIAHERFPKEPWTNVGASEMSFYVDDPVMKQEVVEALQTGLEHDQLKDFDRIAIEELLAIQQSQD